MSISQILDDFDIDEKSLHGYVRDGRQMNLTPHLITCVWWWELDSSQGGHRPDYHVEPPLIVENIA